MTWFLMSLAYFALAASLHAVFRRIQPRVNTVAAYMALGGACGLALVTSLFVGNYPGTLRFVASLSLYAFLSELYLFCLTFVFGSISAAVLVSHLDRDGASEGDSDAPPELMIGRRLAGMCRSGLISENGGRFQATGKGRFAARAGRALRAFFRHQGVPEASDDVAKNG